MTLLWAKPNLFARYIKDRNETTSLSSHCVDLIFPSLTHLMSPLFDFFSNSLTFFSARGLRVVALVSVTTLKKKRKEEEERNAMVFLLLLLLSWCLMSSDVIWHIRDKLWPMPKHGSIRKVYACLAVTCHLHFWQNDRDFLRATVVTRGWNGYRNKSQHRKSTLEKKILPPFQQGFEPATFQSRVRRSNHWAIPAPNGILALNSPFIKEEGNWDYKMADNSKSLT